jgi:G:T/U mismatch-specific DNA glycosylase
MSQCNGFQPIEPLSAKVLILGTMPSVESLNQAFYYAHPRNAFWPIMQKLLNRNLASDAEKTHALQEAGILLWDVLEACHRQGSLDSAIQQPEANDFTWIFAKHPHLKTVIFNGKAAETLFKRYVLKTQTLPHDLQFLTLAFHQPGQRTFKF